ncbi:MAG: SIR2 family protein [Actinobacteria bacterium]|nr:SIR2 family protein [Actinomycetota bacterium]
MFREDELLILIGAGCSCDAGIPASKQMIGNLEGLIDNNHEWQEFFKIYNYVKSAVLYADGIAGKFSNNFDIERLVNVLGELEKKENSIIYPFIGSWNPRLLEIAGHDLEIVNRFKRKILEQLKRWISLGNYGTADYYKRFFDLQADYNYSLRVFSLNYDLCFEKTAPQEGSLERGFDSSRVWDWRRFEPRDEYQPGIYLYKLHGSIDWERDFEQGDVLRWVENIPETPDLIFGTDYKMQYIDPFLFFAYELRKYSLESKVILTLGYSFRDEHINGILKQALRNNITRKVIIVSPDAEDIKDEFQVTFPGVGSQLTTVLKTAKEFLDTLSEDFFANISDEVEETGEESSF